MKVLHGNTSIRGSGQDVPPFAFSFVAVNTFCRVPPPQGKLQDVWFHAPAQSIGQGFTLQSVEKSCPHTAPPFAAGSTITTECSCFPPPQVAEQLETDNVNLQSTGQGFLLQS